MRRDPRICGTCGEDQWFCEHSSHEPGALWAFVMIVGTILALILGS